jgi:tetratricopeptide (TPR) repeat protein
MTDPQQLYAQLVDAFNQHDWSRVRVLGTQLLPMARQQAEVHYLTGIAYLELRDSPRAVTHLGQATQLNPKHVGFAVQYARSLVAARLLGAAREAADRAMALGPNNAQALSMLGNVYAESLAHAEAASAFQQAAALEPNQANHRYNSATALMHIGDINRAERELEACIAMDPSFWRAYLAQSNLRRQTPETQRIPHLRSLLERHPRDREARLCLLFALAKEHEDLNDYSQAFEYYMQGNATGREDIAYTPEQDATIFSAMERTFSSFSSFSSGFVSEEPIFVFGMPRSGTTLVERILSSHPDVSNAGELQNFGMAVRRAWNTAKPFWLDVDSASRLPDIDWQRIGSSYIASTRPGTGQRRHFIDKFPFNFLYAGFIAHALPKAKLICLRRNPLDTCLGNFRQLFAGKLPYYHYSFDLLDTGRYYILFDRLMAHWRKVLPGRILELRYESLVEHQEAETHRLLEYCKLNWHAGCLHFERNAEPVATASSLQVRQPMFRSSLNRWRPYERELEPLRALLLKAGIELAS